MHAKYHILIVAATATATGFALVHHHPRAQWFQTTASIQEKELARDCPVFQLKGKDSLPRVLRLHLVPLSSAAVQAGCVCTPPAGQRAFPTQKCIYAQAALIHCACHWVQAVHTACAIKVQTTACIHQHCWLRAGLSIMTLWLSLTRMWPAMPKSKAGALSR